MRAAPQTLDPAAPTQDPAFARIAPLLYDTLIRLGPSGRPFPALASSCQQETDRRWRCTLRSGVRFADGTALTAALVAQSLHDANPDWNPHGLGDSVIIESDQPLPNLSAVLALPRNSIVLREGDKLLGTGPFRVADFQPARRLALAAVEDGWQGRPFVDSIEFQFNRIPRDQLIDLELNRADVVEIAPDQLARLASSGRRIFVSDPVDLLALRFSHSNVRDARLRQAIALAVDRDSIVNVLFQRHGEAAASLLPNWITGYAFLFAAPPQLGRARQLRAEARQTAPLTLVYDATDPLARLVAERIALNVGDAGITLKTLPSTQNITVPDVELLRLRLPSTDPAVALAELARTDRLALSAAGPPLSAPGFGADKMGNSTDRLSDLYHATVSALQENWAVPIAYLPAAYAISPRVRNWTKMRDGSWDLADVWLVAGAGEKGAGPIANLQSTIGNVFVESRPATHDSGHALAHVMAHSGARP